MKHLFYKTTFLLMLAAALFTVTSCEEEGAGGGPDAAAKLVGTWKMTDSEVMAKIGGIDVVQFLMASMELTQAEAKAMVDGFTQELKDGFNGTIIFKEDNTYTLTFPDNPAEIETGTWRVSEDGKKLYTKVTGDDEDDPVTIVSLTDSMLVIKFDEQETVDLDDDDVEETTVDMEIEITLTKQ